tara:strand:+ start:261 stop:1217 length:957 start_codon:yes stop_codon:yes gene_type:complete
MKFLNRKEQVLELHMTQHGKSLLSRGAFKPVYYAFFDDDVIYDSQYMSDGSATALENSTKASDRIRKANRTEPQYNYAGVETNITKLLEMGEGTSRSPMLPQELTLQQKLEELSKPPSAIDNYYSLGLPMGTSEYNSDKAPAWSLQFSSGEITGSVLDYTGSSGLLKIPQIEVEIYYDIHTGQYKSKRLTGDESDNVTVFPDDSYIKIEKDYMLVDFGEHNSLFENENFDIEVYEIIDEPSANELKQQLNPLYFIDSEQVENDKYYSENVTEENIKIINKNVEYYFDVRVDDEIGDEIGIVDSTNIYKTLPENDEEPC